MFIVTNADEYSNYKIIKAPVHSPQRSAWEDFYIPEPGIKIEDIDMFKVTSSFHAFMLTVVFLSADVGGFHILFGMAGLHVLVRTL